MKHAVMTSWVALTAAIGMAGAAWAGARVIDLTGQPERAGPTGAAPLALFETLAVRDIVVLRREATLTLIFDQDGRQFLLRGPGRWQLQGDRVVVQEGPPPQPLGTVASGLRPAPAASGRLTAGAVAMRNAGTAELALAPDATRLLSAPEALVWADAGAGSRYRVRLGTARGDALHEAVTDQPRLALSTVAPVAEGGSFAWSVDVEAGPRSGARAFAAFTVADAITRAHWAGLAPAADAPVSQWVLYAHALDSAGYADEARRAWAIVSERRPGVRVMSRP